MICLQQVRVRCRPPSGVRLRPRSHFPRHAGLRALRSRGRTSKARRHPLATCFCLSLAHSSTREAGGVSQGGPPQLHRSTGAPCASSPTAVLPCARRRLGRQVVASSRTGGARDPKGRAVTTCHVAPPSEGAPPVSWCSSGPHVEMDDEFARFQAELGALEETEAPGEEPQKAPVEAPTPVPAAPPAAAHVSSAQLSRSAVIARPAAPASVQAGEGRVEYAVRAHSACLPSMTRTR